MLMRKTVNNDVSNVNNVNNDAYSSQPDLAAK